MSTQAIPPTRLRRWTRAEAYRLNKLGLLKTDEAESLELIDGQFVSKARPATPRHAAITGKARKTLAAALPSDISIWPVCPLAIDDYNEPEPDIIVLAGGIDDYIADHPYPADTHLLIEVSEETLDFDRGVKAQMYAQAGIVDYWIVNLVDHRLEVRRDPTPGGRYRDVRTYGPTDAVSPLTFPQVPIPVADLMPLLRV